jgi:hypothetical protein
MEVATYFSAWKIPAQTNCCSPTEPFVHVAGHHQIRRRLQQLTQVFQRPRLIPRNLTRQGACVEHRYLTGKYPQEFIGPIQSLLGLAGFDEKGNPKPPQLG